MPSVCDGEVKLVRSYIVMDVYLFDGILYKMKYDKSESWTMVVNLKKLRKSEGNVL